MIYIILAFLGYFVIHFSDPVAIKRLPLIKPILWVIGVGILAYAVIKASLSPEKVILPGWTLWVGWGLLVISLTLVAYSLYISLPFRMTYISKGAGNKLITTGLYALIRHPWLYWSFLVMLSLVLVSQSKLILVSAPLFALLEIIAVFIQDYFYFPRMFAGYKDYRRATPMLIPNYKSIKAYCQSIKKPKSASHTKEGEKHVELI
jgi:protein-S-isoprenylcysteine O-methyltransferase Ste14